MDATDVHGEISKGAETPSATCHALATFSFMQIKQGCSTAVPNAALQRLQNEMAL